MSGPGKSDRRGISLLQLTQMFPDDHAARVWFESVRWPDGRRCPRCQGAGTHHVEREIPMPYHCKKCRQYFSVRTGTIMSSSKLGLRKWVLLLHLMSNRIAGAAMKPCRDLGVGQKTAWMMGQKIRAAQPMTRCRTYLTDRMNDKPKPGRPVKYQIEPIDATAQELAQAIFDVADRPAPEAEEKHDDELPETV